MVSSGNKQKGAGDAGREEYYLKNHIKTNKKSQQQNAQTKIIQLSKSNLKLAQLKGKAVLWVPKLGLWELLMCI